MVEVTVEEVMAEVAKVGAAKVEVERVGGAEYIVSHQDSSQSVSCASVDSARCMVPQNGKLYMWKSLARLDSLPDL